MCISITPFPGSFQTLVPMEAWTVFGSYPVELHTVKFQNLHKRRTWLRNRPNLSIRKERLTCELGPTTNVQLLTLAKYGTTPVLSSPSSLLTFSTATTDRLGLYDSKKSNPTRCCVQNHIHSQNYLFCICKTICFVQGIYFCKCKNIYLCKTYSFALCKNICFA